jgi:HAD superfamily hydrolase (TIGR01490 family)
MDRTLVRENTGRLYVRYLRKKKQARLRDALRVAAWVLQYKLGVIDAEKVTRQALATMKGHLEEEHAALCRDWFDEMVAPLVSSRARDAVREFREKGFVIAILSASSPYATAPVAKHLGIEDVICTRLEVEEGRFTGAAKEPLCYGAGKVHWAEEFARERDVDLDRSFFFTDSLSDLPMLLRVGNPRVVNPDPRLRVEAWRRGWETLAW